MVAVGAIIALSGYKMALDTVTRSRLDYIIPLKQSWPHKNRSRERNDLSLIINFYRKVEFLCFYLANAHH